MKIENMDPKYQKTKELLFELQVGDIMRSEAIIVSSTETMQQFRTILREHRISGTPVVDDGKVVGMITLADLIAFLAAREEDCLIREKMTANPVCLYNNQRLIHAIKEFDRHRFGRFPVVDHRDGTFRGILTKGLIIEGMLKRMEAEMKEEELRQYRASHIFEDIAAEYKEIYLTYEVIGKDFEKAGTASTRMKRNLKRLGIRPDIIHRLAIASYEAEMNCVIYADRGVMEYRIAPEEISFRIHDQGPGIEDLEKALQPGFSTAGDWVRELGFGAGMGIPNIKKCADKFDLRSTPGVGTTLKIWIYTGNNDEAE